MKKSRGSRHSRPENGRRQKRPPFTWHYYSMAAGAFALLLAAVLSAWSAAVAAAGFLIISHPGLKFVGLTRQVILIMFALIYVFAFPSAEEVRRHFGGSENEPASVPDKVVQAKRESCLFCICPPPRR